MTAAKSIEMIYKILESEIGKKEALDGVIASTTVAIHRLIEDGKELNEKNITEQLAEFAQDYMEASKNKVA